MTHGKNNRKNVKNLGNRSTKRPGRLPSDPHPGFPCRTDPTWRLERADQGLPRLLFFWGGVMFEQQRRCQASSRELDLGRATGGEHPKGGANKGHRARRSFCAQKSKRLPVVTSVPSLCPVCLCWFCISLTAAWTEPPSPCGRSHLRLPSTSLLCQFPLLPEDCPTYFPTRGLASKNLT